MLKHIVEGHSPDSMVEASLEAMNKAAVFLSENHDIRIAVLEMTTIRKLGYKVVLEVSILPLGRTENTNLDGPDAAARNLADARERERRKADDAGWKRRIVEHFRRRKGVFLETQARHLSYMTEMMLMGQIENEFRAATQPDASPYSLMLPDPSRIQASHRVSDKIHIVPIGNIVENEFQHATHPKSKSPSSRTEPHGMSPSGHGPHEEPE